MDDLWGWVSDAVDHFRETRDRKRYVMATLYHQATQFMDKDPAQALDHLRNARQLAQRLNEPWWTMLCDHWLSQTLIHRTREIGDALEIASEAIAAVESNPVFADFPQRICLHDDRTSALQMMDPFGYDSEIERDCAYIEREGASLEGCRNCLRSIRIDGLIIKGDLDNAQEQALSALKECRTRTASHYTSQYYVMLCRIAKLRGEWAQLEHWARAGALFFGQMGSDLGNIELLMWHAAALRGNGKSEEAGAAYRKARRIQKKAKYGQAAGYYDALACYHELGKRLDLALIARGLELKNTQGAPYLECCCRLERVRLLRALGRSDADERDLLMQAAERLRDPGRMMDRLAAILAGNP